jgi:nitroimidazol reductase NimA-like FMN-containing flavoprotein (pyridoxamine 5'-phosphate oxidase superfamily)
MGGDVKTVLSNEECEKMIEGTYQGILVMCREREPYAVPMNHAYRAGRFTFHCAPTGEKLDLIRENPRVVYVINRYWGRPEDRARGLKCHGCWESVIARGSARVVEDREELREAFKSFMAYQGKASFEPSEKALLETRAIVVDVERMTARRENDKKETEFYVWEPPRGARDGPLPARAPGA